MLKPKRFDVDPAASSSAKLWRHWPAIYDNFPETTRADTLNKLFVLINYVSAEVYHSFCEATTHEIVIKTQLFDLQSDLKLTKAF